MPAHIFQIIGGLLRDVHGVSAKCQQLAPPGAIAPRRSGRRCRSRSRRTVGPNRSLRATAAASCRVRGTEARRSGSSNPRRHAVVELHNRVHARETGGPSQDHHGIAALRPHAWEELVAVQGSTRVAGAELDGHRGVNGIFERAGIGDRQKPPLDESMKYASPPGRGVRGPASQNSPGPPPMRPSGLTDADPAARGGFPSTRRCLWFESDERDHPAIRPWGLDGFSRLRPAPALEPHRPAVRRSLTSQLYILSI